jgi:hypothetical protein
MGDLTEIYNDLSRLQLAADIADEATKSMTEAELKIAVDRRAVQLGTPLVQVNEGSIILQLSQFLDSTVGAQVLVALGLLLKKGPEVASFPHRLREKWYSSAEDALRARNAYERLKREAAISVVETPLLERVRQLAQAKPASAGPSRKAPAGAGKARATVEVTSVTLPPPARTKRETEADT